MRNSIFFPIITLGILALALVGADKFIPANTEVLGQNTADKPSIVDDLSQKLGVDKTKVQQAFDDLKSEKQAQRKQRFELNLDQAVKDGKITEAQKQLILNKQNELMDKHRKDLTDLQNWANQNGIDPTYLFGGHAGHMGMKGRFWGRYSP